MPLKMYEESKTDPLSKIGNILAIAAGKGGVGKSSVTVNLALALKHQGRSVGILDADVYGPSLRKMLPEDYMPSQQGQKILPAISMGIKVISMAYFRKENEAVVVRAPIANGVISQFLNNVEWGPLDYLLIDFPPGTGDVQLTLSQQAHLTGAVMVTTPQDVAVIDVRKAMGMFEQVNVPIVGVVENMSYYYHRKSDEKVYLFGKGGGDRLAKENGVPLLGEIPIDPHLCSSSDRGESLLAQHADSDASKAFFKLAEHVETRIKEMKMGAPMPVYIKEIKQKDNHHFTIIWGDGETRHYRLSELQKQCPCAKCVDEWTGKRLLDESTVDENVKAVTLANVGRYAIKIHFTSGCSTGIYGYGLLRKLGTQS